MSERQFVGLAKEDRFYIACNEAGSNAAYQPFRTYDEAKVYIESLGVGHETQRFFIAETIAVSDPL